MPKVPPRGAGGTLGSMEGASVTNTVPNRATHIPTPCQTTQAASTPQLLRRPVKPGMGAPCQACEAPLPGHAWVWGNSEAWGGLAWSGLMPRGGKSIHAACSHSLCGRALRADTGCCRRSRHQCAWRPCPLRASHRFAGPARRTGLCRLPLHWQNTRKLSQDLLRQTDLGRLFHWPPEG